MDDSFPCAQLHPAHLTEVRPLKTLRIKMTDKCPYACWFCHNEGTGTRDPSQVPDLQWSAELDAFLASARTQLGITEVHLTGGEPTANPHLPDMVRRFKTAGLHVKMTTIGMPIHVLNALTTAGIDGINFSLHSLDAEEFLTTQVDRTRTWATQRLRVLADSILHAKQAGLQIQLNTVVTGVADISRVQSVLAWAETNSVAVRLLNEVSSSSSALPAIAAICANMGAVEMGRVFTQGSSSYLIRCRTPQAQEFGIKLIRPNYLEETMCNGCEIRRQNRCGEKFYGLRLEPRLTQGRVELLIRLCVHRSDRVTVLPIGEFFQSAQCGEFLRMLYSNHFSIRSEQGDTLS